MPIFIGIFLLFFLSQNAFADCMMTPKYCNKILLCAYIEMPGSFGIQKDTSAC